MTIEKLLTIVESISDGVMAVNLEQRVTYFNRAAERITGKRREEVLGLDCEEVMNVCEGECALRQTLRESK
ncbi:MAG TPA: PAS domain-containing protein, partial [Bacteroidetes bacterium]|nr:PAS domain-containing protein [Bacteroidota bacterium]